MGESEKSSDQIAHTVGEVCMWWAELEDVLLGVSLHLCVLLDPAFDERGAWDILHLILATSDFRQKTTIAKLLAHHVNMPDSPDFYDRAEQLLNHLDNNVRPERNRYIHDTWIRDGESILRSSLSPHVKRPQSRQRVLDMWAERQYPNLEDMREFVRNLELAREDLIQLDSHIAWLTVGKGQREVPSQPLPPVWQSFAHRDWLPPDKRQHPPGLSPSLPRNCT